MPHSISRRLLFGLLASVSFVVGCSDAPSPSTTQEDAGSESASPQSDGHDGDRKSVGPSVLLVTIDTARPDAYGAYGGPVPTPVFDAIAREGALFTNANTVTPITNPAHASLLTGLYPYRHGIRDNGLYSLAPSADTLAEILGDKGYRTSAFISAIVLDRRYGLDQGFDHYDDTLENEGDISNWRERRAEKTIDLALSHLQSCGNEESLFFWVHLYDPHVPYAPPKPFSASYRHNPYHGEIAYTDGQLGRLTRAFRQKRPESYIVLTSDHGESLGEHGEDTHGVFIYRSTMHIPLAMSGPGIEEGQKVDAAVALVDVFATILAWTGTPIPEGLDAFDLMGILEDPSSREPILLESLLPHLSFGWSALKGVTNDQYKLIRGATSELYNLEMDVDEKYDIALAREELVREMEGYLQGMSTRPRLENAESLAFDPKTRESLESLGYLSSSAFLPEDEEDMFQGKDPRKVVGTIDAWSKAKVLIDGGQHEIALPMVEKLLRSDKDNPLFRQALAQIYVLSGEYEKALPELSIAIEKRPDLPSNCYYLGLCHERLGDKDTAQELYRRTLEIYSRHARAAHGLAELLWAADEKEEAQRYYRLVLECDSGDSEIETRARERLRE